MSKRATHHPSDWKLLSLLVLVLFLVALFLNNASILSSRSGAPTLPAHRGVSQLFEASDLTGETCTATRIFEPRHEFLENTLPSMQRAFELGAAVVEIDVHPTTDGEFAVFHDWALDCRTDGRGVTREHAMSALRQLDVGYGYTADGGRTHPFRGRGVGMMPSLHEVLRTFPQREFLINVKSADPQEGAQLATFLESLHVEQRARLMVNGAEAPIGVIRERLPEVRTMSRQSLRRCIIRYAAFGWTGQVPEQCRGMLIILPLNVAPWLWGWPNRFLDRLEGAGSRVFVQGDYSGGWSTGLNTRSDYERLPDNYSGGIMTDDIELISSLDGQR